MSGKTSQWGILIIVLVGLAILLFGMKKPETTPPAEIAAAETPAETPPKKIIVAKRIAPAPSPRIVEAEREPILTNEGRSILRN